MSGVIYLLIFFHAPQMEELSIKCAALGHSASWSQSWTRRALWPSLSLLSATAFPSSININYWRRWPNQTQSCILSQSDRWVILGDKFLFGKVQSVWSSSLGSFVKSKKVRGHGVYNFSQIQSQKCWREYFTFSFTCEIMNTINSLWPKLRFLKILYLWPVLGMV